MSSREAAASRDASHHDAVAPDVTALRRAAARATAWRCAPGSHFLQLFENEAFLTATLGEWFAEGLERGEACVAIVTAELALALSEALLLHGFDPRALGESGQLRLLDVHDTLERCGADRQPLEAAALELLDDLLAAAAAGRPAVRVFSGISALLATQGLLEQADRFEDFWDRLRTRRAFTLGCAYPIGLFGGESNARFFRDLCDRHAIVIPAESFLGLEDEAQRNRCVGELQQQALALAGEAARCRREQARVRQRDERLRQLVELSPDAIWVNRGGRIVEVNERCLELLGARYDWQVIGRSPLDFIHADFHAEVEARIAAMQAGLGDVPPFEERVVRLDGAEVEVVIAAASFDDDGETAIQVVIRDVRERRAAREADERAARRARTDETTGLLNRAGFQRALAEALERAEAGGGQLVMLQVDLDRFQLVNDTLGHEAGDEVLRQASQRMQRALRDGQGLARPGGDEFLLFSCCADAVDEGHRIAAKLTAAFHEPFEVAGRTIFSTPSIGVAAFPRDGADVDRLMRCADLALHAAKKGGGNAAEYYAPSLAADFSARLDLENRLHRALEQDEFRLCYQPIYDVSSGQVVAVEALLRWFPQDGPVTMPSEFIPVAEETGLIRPIGDWVLRTACAQVRAWQRRHAAFAGLRLAVNVSPRQLHDMDPRGSVARFLDESGLAAADLTLELTESSFLREFEPTLRKLDELRAMGVRLSIDDFGTGYSCLAYLRRLPIDELKIDRSFVHELVRSPNDSALVGAILAMARALKLEVIAEGVESWDQLEMLRDKGCRRVQGYGLGRPMFAEQTARYLASRATVPATAITAGSFQRA